MLVCVAFWSEVQRMWKKKFRLCVLFPCFPGQSTSFENRENVKEKKEKTDRPPSNFCLAATVSRHWRTDRPTNNIQNSAMYSLYSLYSQRTVCVLNRLKGFQRTRWTKRRASDRFALLLFLLLLFRTSHGVRRQKPAQHSNTFAFQPRFRSAKIFLCVFFSLWRLNTQ